MNTNLIRGALVNYEVYAENEGSERLLGVASLDLPELENLSTDLKGAGLLGEVSQAIIGHYSAMSITIHWRTIHADLTELAAPYGHKVTFRGAIQNYDAGQNRVKISPVKITVNGTPNKASIGKFEPGEQTDSETELGITYLKIEVDGEELVELDQLNYVCRINGVDYVADVKDAVGR